jgi:hypothetical protein
MASGERLASTTVGDVSLSSEPAVAMRAPVRHTGGTSVDHTDASSALTK